MDAGIKKDVWSVMEYSDKAPGDKDLSKMKTQYQMFVDDVGSNHGDSTIYNLSWYTY